MNYKTPENEPFVPGNEVYAGKKHNKRSIKRSQQSHITDQSDHQPFISDSDFRVKGVSKLSKEQFTFENYLFCLQNQRAQRTLDFRIQSKCQQLSSNIIQKIGLSGFSDIRFIFDCGIHTAPFSLNNCSRCYED